MSKSPRERVLSLLSDFATAVRADNDALAQTFMGRIATHYAEISLQMERDQIGIAIVKAMSKCTNNQRANFQKLIDQLSQIPVASSTTTPAPSGDETYSAFPTGAASNRKASTPDPVATENYSAFPTGAASGRRQANTPDAVVTENYSAFPSGAAKQRNQATATTTSSNTPSEPPRTRNIFKLMAQQIRKLRQPKDSAPSDTSTKTPNSNNE